MQILFKVKNLPEHVAFLSIVIIHIGFINTDGREMWEEKLPSLARQNYVGLVFYMSLYSKLNFKWLN